MIVCSPHCGLRHDSTSGGEVYERELLPRLAPLVGEVHAPTARPGPPGVRYERVWPRLGLRWPVMPLAMLPAIRRCWRAHRFDLLRAHSLRFVGPSCVLASRRLGVPLVAQCLHVDPPSPWDGIDRWVARAAARVVTISDFSKRQIVARYGVPEHRILIARPGVGPEFCPARQFRPQGRTKTLLFVGGLKPRKDPLFLADILAAVVRRGVDARLVVVGDGPLRGALTSRLRDLGVRERATLMGRVADEDRPWIYKIADVLVFPSRLEGFGMPVLEAMASGVPVVCSWAGALAELVRYGVNGYTHETRDPEGYAFLICTLLDTSRPRRVLTRQDIIHEGLLTAKRHTWEKTATAWAQACKEAT